MATAGSLGAAQQGITKALTQDTKNPQAALADLLSATEAAASELKRNPANTAARDAYNFALARVFTKLRDAKIKAWDKPLTVSGASGSWELTGTTTITKEPILGKVEFIPSDQIKTGGSYTKDRLTKAGLGAPLIGIMADAAELKKKDRFVQGGKHCTTGSAP